ncbi:MAG: hypothetical protein KatS3mg105_4715 [Gemmatales bacterium]|nr:MAG: hypothetical protein KatS3mg105_4715 [Gemmatales bacterium]
MIGSTLLRGQFGNCSSMKPPSAHVCAAAETIVERGERKRCRARAAASGFGWLASFIIYRFALPAADFSRVSRNRLRTTALLCCVSDAAYTSVTVPFWMRSIS